MKTAEIDGCENCKHNKPTLEEGYYCINNCINGSHFEAEDNVKYTRQQKQPTVTSTEVDDIKKDLDWWKREESIKCEMIIELRNKIHELEKASTPSTETDYEKEERILESKFTDLIHDCKGFSATVEGCVKIAKEYTARKMGDGKFREFVEFMKSQNVRIVKGKYEKGYTQALSFLIEKATELLNIKP